MNYSMLVEKTAKHRNYLGYQQLHRAACTSRSLIFHIYRNKRKNIDFPVAIFPRKSPRLPADGSHGHSKDVHSRSIAFQFSKNTVGARARKEHDSTYQLETSLSPDNIESSAAFDANPRETESRPRAKRGVSTRRRKSAMCRGRPDFYPREK